MLGGGGGMVENCIVVEGAGWVLDGAKRRCLDI
jgi:hypothetical protein